MGVNTAPAKNIKTADSKTLDFDQLFAMGNVDEILASIKEVYTETPEQILAEKKATDKRQLLINWITNPSNDVKIIIAFSGGKDSVAMVLHMLFVLNIPANRIQLWHHEVDGHGENLWDWKCTTSYCEAFAKAFGVEILFSYREGGITREINRTNELVQDVLYQEVQGGEFYRLKSKDIKANYTTRHKFPAVDMSLRKRWCSSTVKIDVMNKVINNFPAFNQEGVVSNIVILTGERRAESTARAGYNEIEVYRSETLNKKRKALTWRSIIDWSDADVWAIMEKHKVQPHPAYELGWSRCSCQTCIFNSPNTWATLNEIDPAKVGKINDIEKKINFTLYAKKKQKNKVVSYVLEDIYASKVDKGVSYANPELTKKWISQATGEFTAPIIVESWKMPKGASNKENSGAK